MASVTGLTAERMLAIEAASVVDGEVLSDHLILTKHDGTQIDAGSVIGPVGPAGPVGGSSFPVVSALGILEPGIPNQLRAGRVLAVADFTTLLGLSTPIGLFNLNNLSNLGSGGPFVNKGAVAFDKGITGVASEAAAFSGSTAQALYIADTGAADPFRIAYGSWGCWFRTAKRDTAQSLIGKSVDVVSANAWRTTITTANVLGMAQNSVGTATGTTDVCDNRWHHMICVYDGTISYMYLDGKLEAISRDLSGPITYSGAAPFQIGSFNADASHLSVNPFFGRIDEVFVTSDVLTLDQVRMLYAAKIAHGFTSEPNRVQVNVRRFRKGGSMLSAFSTPPLHYYPVLGTLADSGSLGNALAAIGGPSGSPGPDGSVNHAVNFVASALQYLSTTDAGLPAGTSARSIGCWFKTSSLVGGGMWLLVYGTTDSTNDVYLAILSTGVVRMAMAGTVVNTPTSYADGQWHFAVIVLDSAAVDAQLYKLYIDGKFVVGSTSALVSTTLGGANKFRVGSTLTGSNYFNGQIDGVFITDYALTSDEIAKLYAIGSLSLPASPKNEGDHVEAVDATNIYMICDTLESQHQIDILVSA